MQGVIVITYSTSETNPPTPNPMTFAVAPVGASAGSVTMTATTATDASGPVEYLFGHFACSSNGGTGGTASSWQTSTTYVDTGLQPNQCYGYKVEARDSFANRTASSTQSEGYSLANVPGAPSITAISATTMTISNDANGNPSATPVTRYAVLVTTADATWSGKYVSGTGTPSATAVWLTDAQIDGLTLQGLTGNTTYNVQSKARNESLTETAFSGSAGGLTGAPAVPPTDSQTRLKGGIRLQGGVRLQ